MFAVSLQSSSEGRTVAQHLLWKISNTSQDHWKLWTKAFSCYLWLGLWYRAENNTIAAWNSFFFLGLLLCGFREGVTWYKAQIFMLWEFVILQPSSREPNKLALINRPFRRYAQSGYVPWRRNLWHLLECIHTSSFICCLLLYVPCNISNLRIRQLKPQSVIPVATIWSFPLHFLIALPADFFGLYEVLYTGVSLWSSYGFEWEPKVLGSEFLGSLQINEGNLVQITDFVNYFQVPVQLAFFSTKY